MTAPIHPPGVTVGRHAIGYGDQTFQVFMEGARIDVGAFCSISADARIIAGSEHITTRASTFPLNAVLFDPTKGNADEAIDKGATVVGNDAWIGVHATVLSGVKIGDGAVVGAGSVVSKSVPAYAIVAGNPAEIIRYRFDTEVRDRLLMLRWWDWSDEEIRAARDWFLKDVEQFLDAMEQQHGLREESALARSLRNAPAATLTPHRVSS